MEDGGGGLLAVVLEPPSSSPSLPLPPLEVSLSMVSMEVVDLMLKEGEIKLHQRFFSGAGICYETLQAISDNEIKKIGQLLDMAEFRSPR